METMSTKEAKLERERMTRGSKALGSEITYFVEDTLPDGYAKVLRGAGSGMMVQVALEGGGQIFSARALEPLARGDRVVLRAKDGSCWRAGLEDVKPIPSNQIEEIDVNDKNNRTMYSLHQSGNGDHTPIFMLGDEHLDRIITYYTKRFIENREKFSSAPSQQDPMLAAMGKKEAWTPERLVGETTSVLLILQPYICEAAVRSGNVLETATNCLRAITKRTAGVDPGPKQIGVDEVPQLEETLP